MIIIMIEHKFQGDQPGCSFLQLCTAKVPLLWCTLTSVETFITEMWGPNEMILQGTLPNGQCGQKPDKGDKTHSRRGRERWRGATTGGCFRGCQTCEILCVRGLWRDKTVSVTSRAKPPQGTWQCRRGRQGRRGGTSWTPVVGRDESEEHEKLRHYDQPDQHLPRRFQFHS